MVERRIDSDIRLIPYYRNDGASLPWSARSTKTDTLGGAAF